MAEYRKTPEMKASRLRWHFNNHEKSIAISRDWKNNNKERVKEYEQKNKVRRVAHGETARARRLNVDAGFMADDWIAKLNEYDHKCAYCGRDDVPLEQDHIIPLSKGGLHCWANIVPACRSCNCKKNNRILEPLQLNFIQ